MAKFVFDVGTWLNDDIERMENANKGTIKCMKAATWEGAKIIADEIANEARKHGNLADGLKIARHRVSADSVDTIIWFDGYDTDGVAYALKANVIQHGRSTSTGTTKKDPFVRRAEKRVRKRAEKTMEDVFAEYFDKMWNGE